MFIVHNAHLEYITPEIKGLLENLSLNQQENYLDQKF